jgi:hypothetical protein
MIAGRDVAVFFYFRKINSREKICVILIGKKNKKRKDKAAA